MFSGDLIVPVEAFDPGPGLFIDHLMSLCRAVPIYEGLPHWDLPDALRVKGEGHDVLLAVIESKAANRLALHPEDLSKSKIGVQ